MLQNFNTPLKELVLSQVIVEMTLDSSFTISYKTSHKEKKHISRYYCVYMYIYIVLVELCVPYAERAMAHFAQFINVPRSIWRADIRDRGVGCCRMKQTTRISSLNITSGRNHKVLYIRDCSQGYNG